MLLVHLLLPKNCSKQGSVRFPLVFVRMQTWSIQHEQKIVDTMLTCDLIYAARLSYDRIILISGDDDFLPPLRTALLRGATVFRIHPQVGSTRASFSTFGARYFEMEF